MGLPGGDDASASAAQGLRPFQWMPYTHKRRLHGAVYGIGRLWAGSELGVELGGVAGVDDDLLQRLAHLDVAGDDLLGLGAARIHAVRGRTTIGADLAAGL